MADFHAADLWVAVLPDTSKVGPAFQKAGKEAGDEFGKNIGNGVDKSLDDVSKKAKDTFSKAGKESGDTFAKELTQSLDRQGGSNVGKALKFSIIQGAKEASDAVVAESNKIKGALAGAFGSGDVAGAIDNVKQKIGGISDVASKVGIDLKGWGIGADAAKAPLDDVDNTLKTTLTSATEVSSVFAGLPGKIGALAGKFAAMATEIGLVVEAAHQLYEQFSQPLDIKINASGGLGEWIEHHTPGDLGKALADAMGADKARKFFGDLFGYDPELGHGPAAPTPSPGGPSGGAERIPYPEHFIGPIPPGGTRAPGGQAPPTPNAPESEANRRYREFLYGPSGSPPTPEQEPEAPPEPRSRRRASSSPGDGGDGRGGGGGSGYRRPATPSASDRKSLYSAGSRVSNLLAFAESLVGTPYSMQLRNDCSGMVSELAAVALGLPPPAAGERFSTANEEQWLMSHGFQPGLGGPGDLNVGWHIGGPAGGHTAATLPGGVHAEQGGSHPGFLIGPGAAGAENPEFEHHAHLHMDSTGGAGPDGSREDPLYTAPSDGDGKKSEGGSQGEDLGKGLVTGALEALGIDGSVFKSFTGKGPLDWGITKLGTGLLNWGMGTFGGQGEKSAGGGPPGTPGGSNPFAALGAMMPGTSNVGPGAGPGGGGDTNIHNAPVNQFNVTQNGVGNDSVQPWQAYTNGANYAAMTDALPTTS